MKSQEINKHKQKLDDLFKKVSSLDSVSAEAEMKSHWARYLCILVSGFIESSVVRILSDFACSHTKSVSLDNFVKRKIQISNPKMGKVLELVSMFSNDWREIIEKETEGKLSESINAIYGNRIKIAHGEGNSDITFSRISSYYADAVLVIAIIEKTCSK